MTENKLSDGLYENIPEGSEKPVRATSIGWVYTNKDPRELDVIRSSSKYKTS